MTVIKIIGLTVSFCDQLGETYYGIYVEDTLDSKKYCISVMCGHSLDTCGETVCFFIKEIETIPSLEYVISDSVPDEIMFPLHDKKIYGFDTHLMKYRETLRTARYYDDSEEIFEIDMSKFVKC